MARRTALLIVLSLFLCSNAGAADPAGDDFAPLYEGPHVLPGIQMPEVPKKIDWGDAFMQDTGVILTKYGWYLAEVTCLVDESGQIRDALLTETMPSRNLSFTIVTELRRHKVAAALGPSGPVPVRFPFRLVYVIPNQTGDLGHNAARLRTAAAKGDARARYVLSRLMKANVSLRTSDLDYETLLRSAAQSGEPAVARAYFAAKTTAVR